MKILEKNITKCEAIFIQDNMLEKYSYYVEIVEDDEDGTFAVVGSIEEKECYDDHWFLWDEEENENDECE